MKVTTSRIITAITTLIVSIAIGMCLTVDASQAATIKPSWQGRTCSAFARWQHHPTTANLDRVITFSLHLRRGYLQADVLELGADAMTAKPDRGTVDIAAQYVGEDCYGGA